MRRRINAALILFAAGLAITMAWLLHPTRERGEPTYKGHSLRYWLARSQGAPTDERNLRAALDSAGTNALPFLLNWLRYERPGWRDSLFQRAPESFERFTIASAEVRADASEEAFIQLGTNAAPALQQLTLLAHDTNAPDTALRAMRALESLGPAGIEALLEMARDTNNPAWLAALTALSRTPVQNPFQPLKVAALVQLIGETNPPPIRQASVHFLGQQVAVPSLAMPPLLHCITNGSSDWIVRVTAITALARFGPYATATLPVLTNALTDLYPQVRLAATNAIYWIVHPELLHSPLPQLR